MLDIFTRNTFYLFA